MPRGMPPFEPTSRDRTQVRSLASYGADHDDICLLIINPRTGKPIAPKTLRAAFREELDTGMVRTNSMVAESLLVQAVGRDAVYDEKGNCLRKEVPRNVTAGIFWAKTRMGWREPSVHEITGKDGGPIQLVITQNQSKY
jgi:hypothetical protein